MSQKKFSTVQSFHQSCKRNGLSDDQPSAVVKSSPVRRSCCSKCDNCSTVQVRPVLCSKVLSEANSNSHRCPNVTSSFNIGNYHKTPHGGAWVERNPKICTEQADNWQRAQVYNEQIENISEEKAARLHEFQRDVKLRVRAKEEAKQQALLASTYREMELEKKVVRRTAMLAQASIPSSSEVMVKGRRDQMFKTLPSHIAAEGATETSGSAVNDQNRISKFNKWIAQERRKKELARMHLMARKVCDVEMELPGGQWRDTSLLELHTDGPIQQEEEVDMADVDEEDNFSEEEVSSAGGLCPAERKDKLVPERSVPHMYSITGQQVEEIRKQEVKQRALLRRFYMDIERQQVKEYKKMKAHLDKIVQLKREKEMERSRLELQAATNQLAALNTDNTLPEEAVKEAERERMARQQKESRRYIKALRSLLREKIQRTGVNVPPLCSCGNSIWDTHPDFCANNCPFYKNPKGYERAMQALLASCDIPE